MALSLGFSDIGDGERAVSSAHCAISENAIGFTPTSDNPLRANNSRDHAFRYSTLGGHFATLTRSNFTTRRRKSPRKMGGLK